MGYYGRHVDIKEEREIKGRSKAAWVEIKEKREIKGRSRGGMGTDQRGDQKAAWVEIKEERLREDQRRHGYRSNRKERRVRTVMAEKRL